MTKTAMKRKDSGRKAADKRVWTHSIGNDYAFDQSGFVLNIDDIPGELTGWSGRRIFSKMSRNSTIAATLFVINMLLSRVTWTTVSSDPNDKEAVEIAEFFESLRGDMDHSWDHFMVNVATCIQYGWSAFEIVYKRRLRKVKRGELTSNYDDGKIGIKKLGFRPQLTLERWKVDPNTGDFLGMVQNATGAAGSGYTGMVEIPVDRLLIFNSAQNGDSPEGRSCLVGAYEDWMYLKSINRSESYGIERELSGLPVMYVPAKLIEDASGENADPAAVDALRTYERIVRDVRLNQQAGVILPSDTFRSDDGAISTVPQYQLSLLSNQGQRQIDVHKAAERKQGNIARVIIADFLLMGTMSKTGSYSLGQTRYDLFANALDAWNESWADVLNRKIIPRIAYLNGMNMDKLPSYKAESVKPMDITQLVDTLMNYTYAGGTILPNASVDAAILSKLGMPMAKYEMENLGDQNATVIQPENKNPANNAARGSVASQITGAQGGNTSAGNMGGKAPDNAAPDTEPQVRNTGTVKPRRKKV